MCGGFFGGDSESRNKETFQPIFDIALVRWWVHKCGSRGQWLSRDYGVSFQQWSSVQENRPLSVEEKNRTVAYITWASIDWTCKSKNQGVQNYGWTIPQSTQKAQITN